MSGCYVDELLSSQLTALVNWLQSDRAGVFVLLGENGSGRTTLAKQLISRHLSAGIAWYCDGLTLTAMGVDDKAFDHSTFPCPREPGKSVIGTKEVFERVEQFEFASGKPALLVIDADSEVINEFAQWATSQRDTPPTKDWKLLVTDNPQQR